MFDLNQLTKRSRQRVAQRRVTAVAAAVMMALLISLTLTMRVGAAGQIVITISEAGMTPTSATASGEIVHLKVVNSSSRETITLRINRANGQLVREVVLPEGTRELSVEVEIGAGQYTVTDTSNTSWSCQLTVQ